MIECFFSPTKQPIAKKTPERRLQTRKRKKARDRRGLLQSGGAGALQATSSFSSRSFAAS